MDAKKELHPTSGAYKWYEWLISNLLFSMRFIVKACMNCKVRGVDVKNLDKSVRIRQFCLILCGCQFSYLND